jgi:aryl-alcohol dehydrogenase-like predicted oxidoreductase
MRFLDAIVDVGCTAIDTAAIYQLAGRERLIGEWISRRNLRNRVFLITTGAYPGIPFNTSTPHASTGPGSWRISLDSVCAELHTPASKGSARPEITTAVEAVIGSWR